MTATLKITLIRSLIGRLPKHKATLQALKLGKINRSVVVKDTPAIRGMIEQVHYLVKVEENAQ